MSSSPQGLLEMEAETWQASENYYRAVFENTGALTLIVEDDMTISAINSECEKVLAYKREDLLGSQWTQLVPDKLVDKMIGYHRQRRECPGSAPTKYEGQLIDSRGQVHQGLFKVDLIPGTKKSVATFVDLTDYKRIDRALRAISAVNTAMIHAEDEKDLLETVCQHVVEVGEYSLAWIGYMPADPWEKLRPLAYAGRDNGYLNKLNIYLADPRRGSGPVGEALRSGQSIITKSIKKDPTFKPWMKDALRRGFKSSIAIPLMTDSSAFGILNIYADEIDAFDLEEERLLVEMSKNLVFAIAAIRAREGRIQASRDLAQSLKKMQRLLMQAVSALGTALDFRDPFTAGHQRKVGLLATAIAEEMGLSKEKIEGITVAGSLHDIGKIGVPVEILSKPEKLSEGEFAVMAGHCQVGYDIIKDIEFPWPVAQMVLQHHERMDGSGYPLGLTGDDILLEARIMAVADVVEAMVSHRPYRPALGIERALAEISQNSGILFDPQVVAACNRLFREKGFGFE